MLTALKSFLKKNLELADQLTNAADAELIQMAAAVLFVEVMYSDHKVDERERQTVCLALQKCFSLTDKEAESLLKRAEDRIQDVTSLHEFTSLLHRNLTHEEKIGLVEQIWRIILADETIDKYEEHLVRQIAELLYLRHSEFIQAKLRVQASL